MESKQNRLRLTDLLIIILATIVIALLFIKVYSGSQADAHVLVRSADQTWRYPLDTERTITIQGLVGDTTLHIHDNTISIIDSPCPTKSCITSGAIAQVGQWLVCLPNGIFLTIEGSRNETLEVDDVSG